MKEIKTNEGLVAFVKNQLGAPFWFGCFGQISSEKLYLQKKEQYPDQYQWECKNYQPETKPEIQLGVRVFDCSGLIKGYWWSDGEADVTFVRLQDLTANNMFEISPEKGEIETIPEISGLLVFADHHVGVYIGGGKVIDARGHQFGVIETELKDRPWTHWGYCPWIKYI